MNGKIYFNNLTDLAIFLKFFTGSTAVFDVTQYGNSKWVLTFTGGY
jgi:hypothetical protein